MKNTTPLSFGEKIKQIRIAKGLKQEELAKVINTAQNFVSRLESGEAKYDDRMLQSIREFYGIENAPIFDHELEDYKNRLWVWNDLIDATNFHGAKAMQSTLSPILELPFERDLTLLYLMIETRILFNEGNLVEGEERLNKAGALLDAASSDALHLYHRNMGFILYNKLELKASLKHYHQSLKHKTSNIKSDAIVSLCIGRTYLALGKPWQAVMYFEQAKMKYDLDRTNALESMINTALATGYIYVGEYDKAEHIINDALTQAKRVNLGSAIGLAFGHIAELYMKKGNKDESLKAYNQALKFLQNHDYYKHMLVGKASLLIFEMKDFAQGQEVLKQCRELTKDDKHLSFRIDVIDRALTLDNSESTDYLEKIAIPHYRCGTDVEPGSIYFALDLCNILEAHYRKKRSNKKANDIAVVGRDIFKEIYFGEVEL